MNPARTDTVHRAVALIGPDEHRRTECVNAVHVALSMVGGHAKDLQRHSQRRGKPGKPAAERLRKALKDLQRAIGDPNLSDELRQIISPHDLARGIEHVNATRIKADEKRYPYKASVKNMAAELAYGLLRQFNRKISITKGSVFCKLAALLYGEPRANLQWTCRTVLSSKG